MLRRIITAIGLAFSLACGGLDFFPPVDVEDVSLEEARGQKLRVPDGSSHIYVRHRAVMDIQVTWARFELDPTAEAAFRDTLRDHTWTQHPDVPSNWPDFSRFDKEEMKTAPSWWAPSTGAPAAYRSTPASQSKNGIGEGHYAVLDGAEVYQWTWTYQWWEPKSSTD